ncbi:SulP family inorganic anion transporter [Leifsonia sp. WHRI 6310E]|uniref:SulP family inorganic anion transporter n=1 Tax=Leifsonia sp. WHRI 6310E TaxID=3162562 RepID=UPI0032EC7C55
MTTAPSTVRRPWLLPTLAGYQRGWLGRDIVAGISAGAVVVPQAMAYATIANLPVEVGLYTAIVPMLVYALLGGSRAMSVSATSTIATLTATTLVSVGVVANSDQIPRDLVTLTLLVGAILFVARLLRLGSLVEIINRPTLLGIQVGVGATVAVGQLPKLLGETTAPTGEGFVRSINAVIAAVPQANPWTALLAVCSIAALFLFKRFLPRVPGPLIVVAAGILLVAFGGAKEAGVELIAPVGQAFPLPVLPSFDHVFQLIPGALAIAVMAFLETAAVARGIRDLDDPRIDSNRELFAIGVANLVGGWFQALPAAGGFSQSAVNKAAGARSQVAAIVTVVLALLIGLFLGPVISLLPQATLAALVFVAVFGLIDVKDLALLWRISKRDFTIAAVVTVIGLTAGLLAAVAVGVLFTLVLVLAAMNKPRIHAEAAADGHMAVTLLGPLYTANVLATEQAVLDAADAAAQVATLHELTLDCSTLQDISITVILAFRDLDRELAGRGVRLRVRGLPSAAREIAARTPWFQGLEADGRVV